MWPCWAQVGALTVARMREVEAEAGLTPAPKADGAAEPAADAGAAEDAAVHAPPSQEVTCLLTCIAHLCVTAPASRRVTTHVQQ